MVGSLLNGYNACIVAYGQTGTGKTWSMLGSREAPGLIPQSLDELFSLLREGESSHRFSVQVCVCVYRCVCVCVYVCVRVCAFVCR